MRRGVEVLCVFMEAWGWLSICSICQIYADHRDTTICFSYTVQVVNLYQMEAAFCSFQIFLYGDWRQAASPETLLGFAAG